MTALLLSIVDAGISQIKRTHNAHGQLSNIATTCQRLPITGVIASVDGLVGANVLDNNLNTAWSNNAIGSWIRVDLGTQTPICSMSIAWYLGNLLQYNFIISVSNDGTSFTNVFAGKSSGKTLSYEIYNLSGGTTGRYVKVTINGNNMNTLASIAELSVDGFSNVPPPTPTADNKNIQTNSGTPVTITLSGTDPIPGDVLKFSVLALPQHGTLTSGTTPNSVAYTPNTGFSGTDSYTYKATDGQGVDSNIATVTITVNASMPRPTVDNKNILTNSGTPIQITLTGTDPIPGDVLKFSVVGNPQHGTITPGTVSSIVFYTPDTGFSGTDSYTYKATDGQGVDSNIATVTIRVNTSQPSDNEETIQATSGSNVWSGFGPLGGNLLGDPAVARNSDGRLEVFVIGTNHALYHKSQIVASGGSGWTGYSTLGGNIISNPVVARNSDGRLEVFVIGTNHALYHVSQLTVGSNSWSGFTTSGGNIVGKPAVARNSDGRLEVFVIGTDHALWHIFETAPSSSNSWSGYGRLGGNIISNPSVAPNSDGRLEVFVVGNDHALYHTFEQAASSSNSWSGISSLGGYIISDPALASNSDGRLEVFVVGNDHSLYHNFQLSPSSSNSWSGYAKLDGIILNNTNPAAALNSQGQLQVFVVGSNNAIFYKFQVTPGSSSWAGYVGLGGFVISDPVVATNSDGRLELFVLGSNHALYHDSELSGSLYDNFEGGKYTLSDGKTSPNAKWLDNFNGFGSAGVQDDVTGTNNVFFETPAVSTSTSQTHSTLVTSTQKWGNLELDIDVKTVQQQRQNSSPNPWEVAWIFFRQTDTFHYYAFLVKPTGIEFDKKDCNTCTNSVQGQQFLVTASSPTLKIGGWSHWKITAIGNHITISVDGNKVIDYVDQTMSQQLSSGAIGMYTEDANVNFDNIFVTPQ
jgi:Domain of Unknown Function (DUF1080)/F5/8 type C domain/Bacterial Ig domain